MVTQNPFTTTFSKIPKRTYIRRSELDKIIDNFEFEDPTESVYKITGVRGSGKTVGLAQIEEIYDSAESKKKGWLVYRLNPTRDMLYQLGADLNKESFAPKKAKALGANVNLSILGTGGGIGGSYEGNEPIFDIGVEVRSLILGAMRKKKKILLTVDEVSKTRYMVEFCLEFGQWLRENLPVYLVCTGLYENVTELGNVKNLTFFKRAPGIIMEPLNNMKMVQSYQKTLKMDIGKCKEFAGITRGYAYAFQQYGSLIFEKSDDAVEELKGSLFGNVYEKIWEELSDNDRLFLRTMSKDRDYKREEIVNALGDKAGIYSEYRDRLLKRGIIVKGQYGYIRMVLPFFNEYISDYCG